MYNVLQLVQKAKEQAEKFRQIPGNVVQNSVFGDINKPVAKDLSEFKELNDSIIFNKSQISGINKFDSGHKQSWYENKISHYSFRLLLIRNFFFMVHFSLQVLVSHSILIISDL